MTYDCGCWTNEDGYWELSPECKAHELLIWSDVVQRAQAGEFGNLQARKRKPKFIYIDKKLRLIEDYELPEDTTE